MRKQVFGRKFSRGKKGRIALLRSLVRALVVEGKIVTTLPRAKAICGQVDKYLNRAKKGGVAWRRKVLAEMGNDRETIDILFDKIAPTFKERKSGFTRIIRLAPRKGDRAEMARLELIEEKQKNENISTKTKRN
jgi:large subunit ribosomal protein L17